MHRLLLIALIAAATACSGKSSSTTPSNHPPAVVDAPISGDALIALSQQMFPAAIKAGTLKLDFGSGGMDAELTEELSIMGITTTTQLAAIVPPDFDTKGFGAVAQAGDTTNIAGMLRDIMIIHDVRGYFTNAWRNNWSSSGPSDFPAPAAYGVDFKVMEELGVFAEDSGEDGGYDPCADEGEGMDDGGGDPCGD